MHELPLLIFTLFLQGSVGVTLWLAFGECIALSSAAARCRGVCPGQSGASLLGAAHGLSAQRP